MTGRAFLISMATVVAVGVIGTCAFRPDPAPLPVKVQAAVDRHVVATAVDTAEQRRLERNKAAELQRELAAAATRHHLEDSIAASRTRADSLAAAARAQESADSAAAAWKAAYDARTLEAEQLRVALEISKAETESAHVQLAAADSIAAVNFRRATRADSVITVLVSSAKDGDHCRIPGTFGLLHCPSRKAAVGAGVVIGVVGTAIATGKIRVNLPLKPGATASRDR